MDVSSGSVLAAYHADEQLIPASTLKLVSTTAAWQLLGSDFRYKTKIMYSGKIGTNGLLDGDIFIIGSGDPTLQSEKFDNSSVTEIWSRKIKEKGIKEISGHIIGYAAAFDRVVPDDWIWADIGNYYGAIPCGLNYKDNKFKLYYRTGAPGSKAELIKTEPQYASQKYNIQSNIVVGGNEDDAYVYGDPFGFQKKVKGQLPPNKNNYEVEAALPDPALLCAEDLYAELTKLGIRCRKEMVQSCYEKNDSLHLNEIYTHYSPSLDKIIQITNLSSNNLFCENLVKTIGDGNTGRGLSSIKKHLSKKGLDTDQLFMSDASGLSRANTITAAFQTQLLHMIWKDTATYNTINNSLPLSGKNGSMANMGKGTAIENNLRAKTGYINRVRAYCGYLTGQSGKKLAFSVMFNNYNGSAKDAKLRIEKLMLWFEKF